MLQDSNQIRGVAPKLQQGVATGSASHDILLGDDSGLAADVHREGHGGPLLPSPFFSEPSGMTC